MHLRPFPDCRSEFPAGSFLENPVSQSENQYLRGNKKPTEIQRAYKKVNENNEIKAMQISRKHQIQCLESVVLYEMYNVIWHDIVFSILSFVLVFDSAQPFSLHIVSKCSLSMYLFYRNIQVSSLKAQISLLQAMLNKQSV